MVQFSKSILLVEEELEFSEKASKREAQQYKETIIKLKSSNEQSEKSLLESQVGRFFKKEKFGFARICSWYIRVIYSWNNIFSVG